jgi:hypothetical protein
MERSQMRTTILSLDYRQVTREPGRLSDCRRCARTMFRFDEKDWIRDERENPRGRRLPLELHLFLVLTEEPDGAPASQSSL